MKVKVPFLRVDRKTGILRYRHVFPETLRPQIAAILGRPLTELKITLEARELTEPGAMDRYNRAHEQYTRLVQQAKKLTSGTFDDLTPGLIAHLVGAYRADEVMTEEGTGWDPGSRKAGLLLAQAAEAAGYDLSGIPEGDRASQGRRIAHEAILEVARGLRKSRDLDALVDAWSDQAAALAASNGYLVDRASPGFQTFCRTLNDTAVIAHEEALRIIDGDVVPVPPVPSAPPKAAKAKPKGRSFREIMLALIDKPRLGISETGKERIRGGVRFLVEAVGDLRPEELTVDKVTEFLDLLAQRPSKLPTKDFHLKLPELVRRYSDRPEVPRLTEKTQEAYVIALNARWKEAQTEGDIPKALQSPFSDRKFKRVGNRPRTAKGFSASELTAYFSLPAFTAGDRPQRGKGEAIYWIPLILLYTGARPEEVAQLLVADIFQHEDDGRWMIRYTDEGQHPAKGRQSLKTEGQESGRRTFPVPKPLLDLGLLAYRAHLQGQGEAALFPLLRRKGKRSGIFPSFGEWMCEYVYDNGVLERGTGRQPSREFRHTWTTASRNRNAPIPREAAEYIQGHKSPDGWSANDGYGERSDLGDWIDQLQLKVDVLELVKPWKPPGNPG